MKATFCVWNILHWTTNNTSCASDKYQVWVGKPQINCVFYKLSKRFWDVRKGFVTWNPLLMWPMGWNLPANQGEGQRVMKNCNENKGELTQERKSTNFGTFSWSVKVMLYLFAWSVKVMLFPVLARPSTPALWKALLLPSQGTQLPTSMPSTSQYYDWSLEWSVFYKSFRPLMQVCWLHFWLGSPIFWHMKTSSVCQKWDFRCPK